MARSCTCRNIECICSRSRPVISTVGLLALGQYAVDIIALYLYPTSAVIRQYKERTTGDLRLVQVRVVSLKLLCCGGGGGGWWAATVCALSGGTLRWVLINVWCTCLNSPLSTSTSPARWFWTTNLQRPFYRTPTSYPQVRGN